MWIFAFFLLLFPLGLHAKEKICLNMIVKNESRVITRCLDSVKPVIDYWVIVDTGSTDGTQEIIKKHLKGIPGVLYERPWKNFGESRTEAFNLAKGKCDYLLFMDADDVLEFDGRKEFGPLKEDLYNMWRGTKEFTYLKPQLVRSNLPWKWVGVTHEYLDCDVSYSSGLLRKVKYVSGEGGARSLDAKKFFTNIQLLKEGLKAEPANRRYMFYLAESYRDAAEKGLALECYQKRIDMGGWEEEIFWSMLQIGHLLRDMGLSTNIVVESYKQAMSFRPHRPEPTYYLAELFNRHGRHKEAYAFLKAREHIAKPAIKDCLFNEDWIEEYGLLFQLSIAAYYVGNDQESLDATNKLLTISSLPSEWRRRAEENRTFPLARLQSKK